MMKFVNPKIDSRRTSEGGMIVYPHSGPSLTPGLSVSGIIAFHLLAKEII